jgi:hypothetical protein
MREAQRRGREDALAGRAFSADVEGDRVWFANYFAGRKGEPPLPPLTLPAELSFALLRAAEAELFEWLGASEWVLVWGVRRRYRTIEALRKRRAAELGLGPNAELPLLRAGVGRLTWALPLVGLSTVLARRRGVRPSLITLTASLASDAITRSNWRRAGLPTRPAGRGRASDPG